MAGGVPCPPFTVAGRQLGATDERDLFAWAVELCGRLRPRALLLENVRGLSMSRFGAYRQHVLDRLRELGYVPGWKLLNASDFGVPQLRPRSVLVALQPGDAPWFRWPAPSADRPPGVGEAVGDLMGARGWPGAARWARRATSIAPTIVGGSKKHGGADLGPTRAKRAWAELGVDGLGLADEAPGPRDDPALTPRLTCAMVARLQGWQDDWGWEFTGRKTARYRQVGNASAARGRGGRRRDPARAAARRRSVPADRRVRPPARSGLRGAAGPRWVPDRPADRRGRPGRGRGARDAGGRAQPPPSSAAWRTSGATFTSRWRRPATAPRTGSASSRPSLASPATCGTSGSAPPGP